MASVTECVINISEGRDLAVVAAIAGAGGRLLLDVHSDADHNRSVLTLGGPDARAVQAAARAVATATVAALDIRSHHGVHPRLGVLDVVPFVNLEGWPLRPGPLAPAVEERDAFAHWAATDLALPGYLYGPGVSGHTGHTGHTGLGRTLPDLRRHAWKDLLPDVTPPGLEPPSPHPSAGAVAVGARPPLVAYNLWLAEADLGLARHVAADLRRPGLRTLGLAVGDRVQVSCNLVDPWHLGPGAAYDAVAAHPSMVHASIAQAELVGLVPRSVLEAEPTRRRAELGLDGAATIEGRLEQAGLV